jgi:hypothetical protein
LKTIDALTNALKKRPHTVEELAKLVKVQSGEVITILRANSVPYSLDGNIVRYVEAKPRQQIRPLIKHPETNGIGGIHAIR